MEEEEEPWQIAKLGQMEEEYELPWLTPAAMRPMEMDEELAATAAALS